MKRFPELNRIIISVMNDDVQVQAIMISNVKNLTKLTYDHSCYFRIFNNFANINIENHLVALVYDVVESKYSNGISCSLESLFQDENDQFRVGIFHEASSNYGDYYLIGHEKDHSGLGFYIKNAKLGIFHFNYQELFGDNFDNYISYIIKYSLANVESSTYLKTMNIKKTSLILSIDQKNQEVSKFSKKNNQLLSKLVTAKKVIRKLSREIYSNPIENGIDFINCINCKNNRRNIIFLPCGDLILCKDCLTLTMKCQANVSIKSEKLKCLKCNERVTQAKEVFY